METFKSDSPEEESGEAHLQEQSTESRERPWPFISAEEHRFIEESGGEYRGFVDKANGERQFEDVLVNHSAYYDENLRTVMQMFVSTEAVNDENGNELEDPGSVKGFSTLIVCRSRSGQTIDQPQTICMLAESFPDAPRDAQELRFIAHQLHRFVVENVGHSRPEELKRKAEAYLTQIGWSKTPK